MKVSEIVGRRKIDLNVDIGEGFANDVELLRFATSANVCCGSHAGSEELTVETIARCVERNIRVGAHPGYPDRASMGRAPLTTEHQREYLRSVFDQVEWFVTIAPTAYIKPHGAFYNETAIALPDNWETKMKRQPLATKYESGGLYLAQFPGVQSLTMMLRIHHLALLGLPGTAHAAVAVRSGQLMIREGFADRTYAEDGTLMPRWEPGAVISEIGDVVEQVLRIAPFVDSICLHGDGENSLSFAETVFKTLVDAGYEVGF